jgi:hypothetical protein
MISSKTILFALLGILTSAAFEVAGFFAGSIPIFYLNAYSKDVYAAFVFIILIVSVALCVTKKYRSFGAGMFVGLIVGFILLTVSLSGL